MDNVREYVRKNTTQIRERLASINQKTDERFKMKGHISNASYDFHIVTMSNCKLNDGSSSINELREYFYSKFKFSLLHNYKTCAKQNKIILTQEHIDQIARKVEHGIFCSSGTSKFNLNYKFMAAQKVTEIDKNTIGNILCTILNESDNINGKEKNRKAEDDLRIINISTSSEHELGVSKNYKESKENVCDSEEEWSTNTNKSLYFDSFDSSSDISKFSDSIYSIGDKTKDLNESDLNNINLSINADNSLKNNVENLNLNGIFNAEQNNASNKLQSVTIKEQSTKILKNKPYSDREKIYGNDTEVSHKKESKSVVQRKSFKVVFQDCPQYGENFELMDQYEYGVMNFEDPDPDISANEDESDSEYTDTDIIEKLRMSNKCLYSAIIEIEKETLKILRRIIDRYLTTVYIPNYYYYRHIFRCIHQDILKKRIYDPAKLRIYAIKKIKSKKYYNDMYEMIGGKYDNLPRIVADYMLSPELHPYQYLFLCEKNGGTHCFCDKTK